MYAQDHRDKLPWQPLAARGGVETLSHSDQVMQSWQRLSQYGLSPRCAACPTDMARRPATNWSELSVANVSYFINLDSALTNGLSPLSGDRHLERNGIAAKPGLFTATGELKWTKELHPKPGYVGNIAFADGHVERFKLTVTEVFSRTAVTNRLLIP